jgi:phosphoribosylanthranilate isomerase
MNPRGKPRFALPIVQIAGIHDAAEARLLEESGVDWLGFPLRLPIHAEDLTEVEAAAVIAGIRAPARAVLITYLDDAEAVAALARDLGLTIVQLHGDIEPGEVATLRTLRPDLAIVKSLVVGRKGTAALEEDVGKLGPFVDAFITDTFDPATGASGATGRTHDWNVSRRLVEISPRPVILAGGLTPDSVAEAIRTVRPAGVDAHTGVEDASGRKSREKVARFVAEARRAFAEIATPRSTRPVR